MTVFDAVVTALASHVMLRVGQNELGEDHQARLLAAVAARLLGPCVADNPRWEMLGEVVEAEEEITG